MKRVISILLALLLAGAAGSGAYYYFIYRNNRTTSGGRVSSTSEDAVYVDCVKIIAGLDSGSGLIARYAGVVEPQETWEAKLEGDKTVRKTYVEEGDEVKAGDKLFTYDTSEDEDKLAQAQIDLERNESDLEQKKFQLESWEKQKPKDNASDEVKLEYTAQLLGYQNDVKQTEYEIRTGKLEVEQLQATVDSADVFCELDGVVKSITNPNSSRNSYYGSEGSDAYITVMAVGDYRVKGTINEQNVYDISEGEEMLAFSRVDDQVWHGVITQIKTDSGDTNQSGDYYYDSGSSDGNSTNYPFYVRLDDSEGLLLGQHVYLEPDEGQAAAKDGIWIPEYYLEFEEDTAQAWVWAASADNKLVRRQVEIGGFDGNMETYEILSGLEAEDYITVPMDSLTEGLPVIYVDYNTGGQDGESLYDGEFDEGSYDVFEFDEGSWDDGSWDDSWDDEDWDDDGEEVYLDEETYVEDFDDGSFDITYADEGDDELFDWEESELVEIDDGDGAA